MVVVETSVPCRVCGLFVIQGPNAFNVMPLDATPGQAGLPAEFKHINKRRKRNLQGFP